MGATWHGTHEWQFSLSGIRRLLANPPKRLDLRRYHASVEFSPLAHELRELERIQIAGRGCPPPLDGGASFTSTRVSLGASSVDTPSPLMPQATHRPIATKGQADE